MARLPHELSGRNFERALGRDRYVATRATESQRRLTAQQGGGITDLDCQITAPHASHARRGFTMLEAVVALAIIGLVCVGVLGAYGATLRADVVAAERLPLAALAEERIAAMDLAAGSFERLPDSLARGTFGAPYQTATWETDVGRVRQSEKLYDVTVRVRDGTDVFTLRTRRYRATATP